MALAGDRESVQKMLGELTRDAGMLALVFGTLDALIKTSSGEEHPVEWWWYPVVTCFSIGAVLAGIWLERTRRDES